MNGGQTFIPSVGPRAARAIPPGSLPGRKRRPDRQAGPANLATLVRRCVRSWEEAGASLLAFLDDWSLLTIFEAPVPPARRHDTRRRRPGRRTPLAARRPARYPRRALAAPLPEGVKLDGIDTAELRRRFPYVAELLAELAPPPAAQPRIAGRRS